VLMAGGYRVHIVGANSSGKRLCCGRTFLAAGMLDRAREAARALQVAIQPWIERGVPLVGLEPSCLLSTRDEHLALLPGELSETIAEQSFLFEEFLQREHNAGRLTLELKPLSRRALLHGHCHQKAFNVMTDVQKTLQWIPGLETEMIESSCCGMAGSFGYAADTYELSVQMAELDLLPAIRASDADALIVADGTSCRHQIADLSERQALHVARVIEMALAG